MHTPPLRRRDAGPRHDLLSHEVVHRGLGRARRPVRDLCSRHAVRGTAVFLAAIAAETIVVSVFVGTSISFLWYNVIGCASVVLLAAVLQMVLPLPVARP